MPPTASPPSPPIPQIPLPPDQQPLFESTHAYIHTYMSRFDASHDYAHIQRVLSNAHTILLAEQAAYPHVAYDAQAVYLAALLHDVGDHKYVGAGEAAHAGVRGVLEERGADAAVVDKVEAIVRAVSWSGEVRDPRGVEEVLERHPELGVVQDADRLDAIGAVGVGRAFCFGAAMCKGSEMQRSVDHFEEKLLLIEGRMKTETGKRMARRRTEVLEWFRDAWVEETRLGFEVR